MEQTCFLHASTNAGRLKVDSIIFEWVLSKMAVAFQFMSIWTDQNRANYFYVDSEAVVFGQTDILLFDF